MQPHLPANKAQGAPGPEQQHLLTTAPSSSSSSLESSTSTTDKKAPIRSQLQAPGAEKASMTGEARTSCDSSGKRWELPLRPTPGFIPCGTPPVFLPGFCLSQLVLGRPCRTLDALHHQPGLPSSLPSTTLSGATEPQASFCIWSPPSPSNTCPACFPTRSSLPSKLFQIVL